MKAMGLQSIQRPKRRYNSYQGTIGKIADNLLKRNFKARKPNEKLVTDVTEFKVNNEKLYLSPMIDLYNGEVISYNLSKHPVFHQVEDMLEKAFKIIPDNSNCIIHSDQGWHYQHVKYQNTLKKNGIEQSMSRKGNCLDNAMMENFFGIMKTELLYSRQWNSMDEFKKELRKYIHYYNH
jgi:putative transposase